MASKKFSISKDTYPTLTIERIKDPNRMWAFPIFGWVAKAIVLIPVFLEIGLLSAFNFFIIIINSFYVFMNRKYWRFAFDLNLGLMRLIAKTTLFFTGVTNKYPGFNFKIEDKFNLEIPFPQKPNRILAFPILGPFFRIILAIPFFIYAGLIQNGSRVAILVSFISIFFRGSYPESTYELTRDSLRLGLSSLAFIAGLSDDYPNFKISTNHLKIKILLIIIGLFFNLNWTKNESQMNYQYNNYNYSPSRQYQKDQRTNQLPVI